MRRLAFLRRLLLSKATTMMISSGKIEREGDVARAVTAVAVGEFRDDDLRRAGSLQVAIMIGETDDRVVVRANRDRPRAPRAAWRHTC